MDKLQDAIDIIESYIEYRTNGVKYPEPELDWLIDAQNLIKEIIEAEHGNHQS